MNDVNGFLILNKDKGCTSHDCVKQVRKLFKTKKVGHSGTLDPQVDGVLPMAIGQATRFIRYLNQDKTYIGTIQLGIRTVTDDIHGKITNKKRWPDLSHKELNDYLNNFRGTISQIPPKVSSVNVSGERAYKKILKNEDFELKAKEVTIKKLLLNNWDQINGKIDLIITCSSGTYIRSIARDLGTLLNSEGCLFNLRRIKASGFDEKISYTISDLEKAGNNINKFVIPTKIALNHIPKFILSTEEEIFFWKTGRKIPIKETFYICREARNADNIFQVLDTNEELLGLGLMDLDYEKFLHPKIVLNAI